MRAKMTAKDPSVEAAPRCVKAEEKSGASNNTVKVVSGDGSLDRPQPEDTHATGPMMKQETGEECPVRNEVRTQIFNVDVRYEEGAESGSEEEQAAFMKELENFSKERNLEFKPPKFYGEGLNCLKLWRVVTRLGGYDRVTTCKLWRQVGGSFKLPKTCTAISWKFRNYYEKALFEYEKHKTGGNKLAVNAIPVPETSMSIPESQDGGNQASGSGRVRRDAATRAMEGWHNRRFLGNGEVRDPIIKDKSSVSLPKREMQLKDLGFLKRKKLPIESVPKSTRINVAKSHEAPVGAQTEVPSPICEEPVLDATMPFAGSSLGEAGLDQERPFSGGMMQEANIFMPNVQFAAENALGVSTPILPSPLAEDVPARSPVLAPKDRAPAPTNEPSSLSAPDPRSASTERVPLRLAPGIADPLLKHLEFVEVLLSEDMPVDMELLEAVGRSLVHLSEAPNDSGISSSLRYSCRRALQLFRSLLAKYQEGLLKKDSVTKELEQLGGLQVRLNSTNARREEACREREAAFAEHDEHAQESFRLEEEITRVDAELTRLRARHADLNSRFLDVEARRSSSLSRLQAAADLQDQLIREQFEVGDALSSLSEQQARLLKEKEDAELAIDDAQNSWDGLQKALKKGKGATDFQSSSSRT